MSTTFSVRPTRADFEIALGKAAAHQIVDPCKEVFGWSCRLYNNSCKQIGFGMGDSAGEAAAFAWFVMNDGDILIDGKLHPENWLEESPYEVPAGYYFEAECGARLALEIIDPDEPEDDGGKL